MNIQHLNFVNKRNELRIKLNNILINDIILLLVLKKWVLTDMKTQINLDSNNVKMFFRERATLVHFDNVSSYRKIKTVSRTMTRSRQASNIRVY